jgi:hypothetical protein
MKAEFLFSPLNDCLCSVLSLTSEFFLNDMYSFRVEAFVLSTRTLKLTGNITEISRAGLYEDHRERVTVFVEGAEPLYAELRLPNRQGWNLGQRVLIVIAPADADDSFPVA